MSNYEFDPQAFWIVVASFFVVIISGIRIVRPTHRGLIERLGKYSRFAMPGFHWIIPLGIDKMYKINITEQMTESGPREMITNDNLNALIDAQIYFRVIPDEENVKKSQYNVYNVDVQIVALAKTTLRNIIGTLTMKSANSERNKINDALYETLTKETSTWGIEIIRTELKQIEPPKDVQENMNKIVKAENDKIAAIDIATAAETIADGQKRANIKQAEGIKQAKILQAEGEAEAIRLVNEAANKYFTGNAQILKKLETVQKALEENTKIIVPSNQDLVNVIGDMAGIVPTKKEFHKQEATKDYKLMENEEENVMAE
ncbi:MAG: SPFH/Band 7/PHB domain protein [Fibrobacter sp.]|jgi:regulator of protease activity HflC (stomatin/prohibitin superfamily)|nr:SPFH/Band 7/PHB domain protein [Fibrobacter sp.]